MGILRAHLAATGCIGLPWPAYTWAVKQQIITPNYSPASALVQIAKLHDWQGLMLWTSVLARAPTE